MVFRRLGGIVDCLAVGEREDEASADEQHGQSGDEGRHPQKSDKHPVGQPDRRAEQQAERHRRDYAEIEEVRREQPGEHHGNQAAGGADRQVEVLVDNDEGHSDGNNANPGTVPEHRLQRLGRAEKGRIDESPADKEQDDQDGQPCLPAAHELGWKALNRSRGGHADDSSPAEVELRSGEIQAILVNLNRPQCAGGCQPPATGPQARSTVSSRSACRLFPRCPSSRAGRACRDWPPLCRGRSPARAA